MGTRINNSFLRHLSTIPVWVIYTSHIGTQKTRTSVSKSVFCGPEKTCFIENTCRNPRMYIVHTHTYDRYTQVWIHTMSFY